MAITREAIQEYMEKNGYDFLEAKKDLYFLTIGKGLDQFQWNGDRDALVDAIWTLLGYLED